MHTSIVARIESGALLVDRHNHMQFPYIWPTAFLKEASAPYGKRHGKTIGQAFQNGCRNLIIASGLRHIQFSEQSGRGPTAQGNVLFEFDVW